MKIEGKAIKELYKLIAWSDPDKLNINVLKLLSDISWEDSTHSLPTSQDINKNREVKPIDVNTKDTDIDKQVIDLIRNRDGYTIASAIITLAKYYCPKDTWYLVSTAYIELGADGVWRVGFSAPYATWVHEIIYFRHASPTRAKFLEYAAYEVLNLVSKGNEPAFTFQFFQDGTNGIWIDINTVDNKQFTENMIDYLNTSIDGGGSDE
jgi:hypothetical protein